MGRQTDDGRRDVIHPDTERVALLGWALYPCSRTSKAGMFQGAADTASCDLDTIDRWSHRYRDCNWRVVAGPSRLFILDIDRPGPTHATDGFAVMQALSRKHGPLPPRPMTHTGGSGGTALFFTHAGEPLRGQSGQPAPGLDPHRGRQAIMIPPSRHPLTGGAYTWRVPPWECHPPPIPAWLATLLRPPPSPPTPTWEPSSERAYQAIVKAVGTVRNAPAGTANSTLNGQAFRLGWWCAKGFLAPSEAEEALLAAAAVRAIPMREALDTIRSGLRGGQRV